MRPLRFGVLAFLLFAGAESMSAAACTTASLSTYDVLGFTCTLGGFTLKNFSYTYVSGTVFPDSTITVIPIGGVTEPAALQFTSNPGSWTVSGSGSSTYQLVYTWDPHGPVQSVDDFLSSPVTAPGLEQVTTVVCEGSAFAPGPTCPFGFTSISMTVFDDGISPVKVNSVSFPSVNTVGIFDTISVSGGGGSGSATFQGVENQNNPEPGTLVAVLFGLAVIGGLSLKRR